MCNLRSKGEISNRETSSAHLFKIFKCKLENVKIIFEKRRSMTSFDKAQSTCTSHLKSECAPAYSLMMNIHFVSRLSFEVLR